MEGNVQFRAVHGENGLSGDGPADALGCGRRVSGGRTSLDQQLTGGTVVQVDIEFRDEIDPHRPAHGFVCRAGQTVEGDPVLARCSGGGLHQVLVAGEHAVESAVGFDVVEFKPVFTEERRQGSGLVQDDRLDLLRTEDHPAAAEADHVWQAGVRADGHAVLGRKGHRPVHDIRIAGVVAAGDVGDVDDAHEFFIIAEFVQAQTFAHIGVQQHTS